MTQATDHGTEAAVCIPFQRVITDPSEGTLSAHNERRHDGEDVAEVRTLDTGLVQEVYEQTEFHEGYHAAIGLAESFIDDPDDLACGPKRIITSLFDAGKPAGGSDA